MNAARDPVMLLRTAIRDGDHALARALVRRFRLDSALARRADHELRSLPRLARWPRRP